MISPMGASLGMATMSVRGIITSRATVSRNSRMLWIISPDFSSMSPFSSPSSMMDWISSSRRDCSRSFPLSKKDFRRSMAWLNIVGRLIQRPRMDSGLSIEASPRRTTSSMRRTIFS